MSAEVTQLRQEETANPAIVQRLEELLERARRGDVRGFLAITEFKNNWYEYDRLAIEWHTAIGLHTRAAYKIQLDWDKL